MNRTMRHKRVRQRVRGTKDIPRLSVYRSLKGLFVQLVDDETRRTLASATHKEIAPSKNKPEQAEAVGMLIAQKAKKINITKIVFDRGGYSYHGRIRFLAEGARKGGLEF